MGNKTQYMDKPIGIQNEGKVGRDMYLMSRVELPPWEWSVSQILNWTKRAAKVHFRSNISYQTAPKTRDEPKN